MRRIVNVLVVVLLAAGAMTCRTIVYEGDGKTQICEECCQYGTCTVRCGPWR